MSQSSLWTILKDEEVESDERVEKTVDEGDAETEVDSTGDFISIAGGSIA